MRGSIDLTTSGLLGAAELPEQTLRQLESVLTQAAGEFFDFTLRVALPGRVSETTGDPERVDGGAAEWSPRLGRTLAFSAASASYNPAAFAAVGAPAVVLFALAAWLLIRRSRRAQPESPEQPQQPTESG